MDLNAATKNDAGDSDMFSVTFRNDSDRPSDFLSSCIFRIDTGSGYEAAGEQVRTRSVRWDD